MFLFLETLLRLIFLVHERTNIDGAADVIKALVAGLAMDVGVLVAAVLPARWNCVRKDTSDDQFMLKEADNELRQAAISYFQSANN